MFVFQKIEDKDRNKFIVIFNAIDDDKDGFISSSDMESFLEKGTFDGMIVKREEFKAAILAKIGEDEENKMDLDAFITFLYDGRSFEEQEKHLRFIFPNKTEVSREEVCKRYWKSNFNPEELKKAYTIEDLH
ncbi:uncharacterized protein LOC111062740 [Nilaparvata lugens]|uniref:uncharacterized protein LOC111062740 n=1 Tax=Nilaparvata lugens TaxID=108931 RepID=UPI00193D616C|nr:uncharacterized protein LOC111062740 [Nilaparvata lugens]